MTTAIAMPMPLSRLVRVDDLPSEGLEVAIEAAPKEREALAREFKVPAIHALTGTFRLSGARERVHVSGRIKATLDQICVVTLDPFASDLEETVEVEFAAPGTAPLNHGEEPPDEIVNGAVDLGALMAEFLALGLDPYPRKPGVDFAFEDANDRPESPFAALAKLKSNE